MVNTYKLRLTGLQQDILNIFFLHPEQIFNGRTLSRKLNVSQPAISKAIKNLIKENLIVVDKDKETNRLSIKLNRDNKKIFGMKRVENLKLVYESGLSEFLEEKFPGCTIILFGSYSRGEDITESDIDIAIVGTKEKLMNLVKFEKILEREIILNFYSSFNAIHKNLKDSILNGILLSGSVDL
ncbi:MAG: nucleotidyltransferase domain-containing protein [Nanoarchaeota archaeon]